jgi:proteasome-associated ATPase
MATKKDKKNRPKDKPEAEAKVKKAVPLARPVRNQQVPDDNALMLQNQQLTESLEEARGVILEQEATLAHLFAQPLVYATVLSSNHHVRADAFEHGDKVLVIDEDLGNYVGRIGTIISDGVDPKSGTVRVEFFGIKTKPHFAVGLDNVIDPETKKPKKKQVQLLVKNDGSNIEISMENSIQQVWNSYRFNPSPGDIAKCNLKTNQVEDIEPAKGQGALCTVTEAEKQVGEGRLEVDAAGTRKIVFNYFKDVEVGDKVVLDASQVITVRHVSNANTKRFKLQSEASVTWDDIGALGQVRQEIDEAIVFPFTYKEIYEFHAMEDPAGFLLYGPPGCGKTLVGKAAAHSLAASHGKEAVQSVFNLVKGPEILSKWVGESEAETRAIFARMRKHYEDFGYPCVTFIDEADAIFSERGSQHAQKWHDTLVAMWLAEMDGFDRRGGMLILASNRPKSIDGAVIRPGRIDKHIKVPRPNVNNAHEIIDIHLRLSKVQLDGIDPQGVVQHLVGEIMNNPRPISTLIERNGGPTPRKETFMFSDSISGSMIATIVQTAKQLAVRRSIQAEKPLGVNKDDLTQALNQCYQAKKAVSLKYDLIDFCENHGMDFEKVQEEPILQASA